MIIVRTMLLNFFLYYIIFFSPKVGQLGHFGLGPTQILGPHAYVMKTW